MKKHIPLTIATFFLLGTIPTLHHDSLDGFLANEHINWTVATVDFNTTGTGYFGDVSISSPSSIYSLSHDSFSGFVANEHIDWTGTSSNFSTSGTLGAGAITGTSFVIGGNTLTTSEWAFLDGQNQAVKTTSDPSFGTVTCLAIYTNIIDSIGGNNITMVLPEALGATSVRIVDNGANEVAAIDSDGQISSIQFSTEQNGVVYVNSQGYLAADDELLSVKGGVGIGVNKAVPTVALDVVGDIAATGVITGGSLVINTTDLVVDAVNHIVEIGSTDGSDSISIYHNNSNAVFKTNDGSFYFQTDEGTNTDTFLSIIGKGTGVGYLQMFDQDDAESIVISCVSGFGRFYTTGTAPSKLQLQHTAHAAMSCFESATEGETPEHQIYGFGTGFGGIEHLAISVEQYAANTAEFYGLDTYLFSSKIAFTQPDGDEYIDSLADGFMDYGATTGHRFNNAIGMLERSSDPPEPAEGNCVVWMSDGTGKGDDGDVLIASNPDGTTKWGTIFDYSGGAAW